MPCCICHTRSFAGRSFYSTKISTNPKKYTQTILLPKTNFPHRLSPQARVLLDSEILENCGFDKLYAAQRASSTLTDEFVLHDGPPYANGVPHIGHAVNKILKDIINRRHLLSGKRIHYRPGWDCHGLPIELKAITADLSNSLSSEQIRVEARDFAKRTVSDQKWAFRSWGVMADWDGNEGCYHTYDNGYVANQLEQFFKLYEKGFIFRSLKPVYWSPSARTALAESELEYNTEHRSTAIFVKFKIVNPPLHWGEGDAFALVWTTTPWTLPANQAIAYNINNEYGIVRDSTTGSCYLLASALLPSVSSVTGLKCDKNIISVKGEELSSLKYQNPLTQTVHPFIHGSHVTMDVGTGLVHTAPAHGHDDFLVGIENKLPLHSIVDENGAYTSDAGSNLSGLEVLSKGNKQILSLLRDNIVHQENLVHSYPYDWRTKRPVIIRSSLQWFIDTNLLKEAAINALKNVEVLPPRNLEGMIAQIERRPYWCISRQRSWGVPIPVLYINGEKPFINRELIEHYQRLIYESSVDFWWKSPIENLVPSNMQKSLNLLQLTKGMDILDIWLDSGLSWSAVLEGKKADLYLEGVDQFTGWFQSSLLTSVALQGTAPFSKIISHGFAVDNKGRKMSKSLGNVVDPLEITKGGANRKKNPPYGVDVLRWWVASHSLQHTTIPISKNLLDDCYESIIRLRNVLKFLLGSINDFPPSSIVEPPILSSLDKYFLLKVQEFEDNVNRFYSAYQFNRVCSSINNFVTNELSSFYCHLTKDRLYCDENGSNRRRATQFVMFQTINVLTKSFAPIMPILAEELFRHHPHRTKESKPYFFDFERDRFSLVNMEHNEKVKLNKSFQLVKMLKEELKKEVPVNLKSEEASCVIQADPISYQSLKLLQEDDYSYNSDLVDILQLSSVTLEEIQEATNWSVIVKVADLHRCERCRKFKIESKKELCVRCKIAIEQSSGHRVKQ